MGKDANRSPDQRQQLSVAVLAGGASSRMGTDKAGLDFEGEPLVVRVMKRLAAIGDDVFAVAKKPLDGARTVLDQFEEQAPLSGLITALRAARYDRVFICACDMPFVDPGVVRLLDEVDADVVVPRGEPLHAVWRTSVLGDLERMWDAGERSVRGAIAGLDAVVVDLADDASFTNVNTPQELDASRSRPARS